MKKLKNFGKALYQFRNSKNIPLEKISNFTKINQESTDSNCLVFSCFDPDS